MIFQALRLLGLAVLGCCPFLAALAAPTDDLLARSKEAMRARLDQAPNYSCILEIERQVLPSASAARYQSKDAFRLEVSVVDNRELFALPGDPFQERPLTDFLGAGVASTGEFVSHARAVFLDPRTTIQPAASENDRGSGLAAFSYQVPVEASSYVLAGSGGQVVSAYEGTFAVDPSSAQPIRLAVAIDPAPPGSGLSSIRTTISYQKTAIAGREEYLPETAELQVTFDSGIVAENVMRYSGCRAFQAETTISFDSPGAAGESAKALAVAAPVQAGAVVQIETTTPISSEKSRGGDPFEAVLAKEIKLPDGSRIPKNALVRGRVRRLETIDTTPTVLTKERVYRIVGATLELTEIRFDNQCVPLSATLKRVERILDMGRMDPGGAIQLDRLGRTSNYAQGFQTEERLSEPGFGTFVIHGELFLVRPGARMTWSAVDAPPGRCQSQ